MFRMHLINIIQTKAKKCWVKIFVSTSWHRPDKKPECIVMMTKEGMYIKFEKEFHRVEECKQNQ